MDDGTDHNHPLGLDAITRKRLWKRTGRILEKYLTDLPAMAVAPTVDGPRLRRRLRKFDPAMPMAPDDVLDLVVHGLRTRQVHVAHPRYFGLFNPTPTGVSPVADALVAGFNPQLASWQHSPFAIEVERLLVRLIAGRFGYDGAAADGTFCSGGAEANHTAVACALVDRIPGFAEDGLFAPGSGRPRLYVSAGAHHSVLKAARLCGLGTSAVREVPLDGRLAMDVEALERQVIADRAAGDRPIMVVGTAGATATGIVESLGSIADVAARAGLWFHVDGAWGGAAAFLPELASVLEGIERADSITFDAHKWFSVPMGAGLFLTRHETILDRTFRTQTGYMPSDSRRSGGVDPYAHSMQWSRRFIGLKVFMSLAIAGWGGYASALRHQATMGDRLRRSLIAEGWRLVNATPLPVVAFVDALRDEGDDGPYLEAVARHVAATGRAWLSVARLPRSGPFLRACITSYRTGPDDIDALVECLRQARSEIAPGQGRTGSACGTI